jgi:transaldolase
METLTGTAALPLADSPLGRTIATTPTDIWNDSCAVDELEYAISYGAVGATANPTIVADVWKADPVRWRDRIRALAAERTEATEIDLAWAIVEAMSLLAAPQSAPLCGRAPLRTRLPGSPPRPSISPPRWAAGSNRS